MIRRELGASGIETPPLILGGNVFGWTADKATSFAVLDRFAEAGGTLIDTADVYSAWVPGHRGGESEAIIGEWLRVSGKRGKVKVATKVGMLDGEGGSKLAPARIAAACDASLARLGVETIDLYFAHQDDDAVPQEDVLAAFDGLIRAGKVQAIGASNFHAARLKSALDIATRDGLPPAGGGRSGPARAARTRSEGELRVLGGENNRGCLPFAGLAGGSPTGKSRPGGDRGRGGGGGGGGAFRGGRAPAVLAAMDEIAAETGATLARIALAWVAAQPGVTAPIASATSLAQVEELVGSWNLALDRAQLDRLTAAGA